MLQDQLQFLRKVRRWQVRFLLQELLQVSLRFNAAEVVLKKPASAR